jgi:hypothetical protein
MPVFQFGPWLPDQMALGNPGVVRAENVFPSPSGYGPLRAFSPATNALDSRPRGAIQARDIGDAVFQYAGDETKLYQNVGGIWIDRSQGAAIEDGEGEGEAGPGPYTTGPEESWEFVPWKNKLLATNFSDFPQQITFGGTEFEDLTTDLRARYITTIRDFVVVANTFDESDGDVPSRVRWSAFNNEEDWTVSPSTLSDFQDLKTAKIVRIFGGESGIIFQPNSVWRMTFAGAPVVFQFDEVLPGIGLIAPGAAVQIGSTVYFLSNQGFFALESGSGVTPIGAGKVDRFVLDDLDEGHLHRITASADNASQRILFAYPGADNSDGRPNRLLVYDRILDRWSLINKELELVWRSGGTGLTTDQLDSVTENLDLLPASLDSSRWVGGAPSFGAFDANYRSGFFDGDIVPGVIESKEFEFHEGGRAFLKGFRALYEGGSVSARVGTRNSLSEQVQFGSPIAQASEGLFNCRDNARYHRMEFTFNGEWDQAMGFEVDKHSIRMAGRRG